MKKIVLETERLLLRAYEADEIGALHAILSDPVTMQYWPAPFTLEGSQQWLNTNLKRYETNGFGRWAMVSKSSGQIIGDCGIVLAELDGQPEYDLGFIVAKEFWGKGMATEAAEACKQYAFSQLGIKRLCANMAFDHHASRRVIEKIGMTKEKEYVNARNRNILTFLYAIEND
ncbi:N-acetyltransferase [Brevibacillus reuszeri]|uniref:GCN5 family acetyltransferase n=1 Tax=Brevibacillus reuszeri TaxID=54915 RepID=A0A0K9YM20_9BACL|nr:GNAT family N-acetyltransferase [Brevibacillus reuszeri]KNB69697.1 GCN5 family acetyltransferase [Brevibacillus reuszeri]MED1858037.1 GNAT family N-acetyltransferase [Brevibacillus reuszeri]GED68972.1 N-acetyltransferase [Brevibacillus reuszeri]